MGRKNIKLSAETRVAIAEYDAIVRAERRLEVMKKRLSGKVTQIPEEEMGEYTRITTELEQEKGA